jgi:hypothetical protein
MSTHKLWLLTGIGALIAMSGVWPVAAQLPTYGVGSEASITAMNDRQPEKGEIWRLQHHNSNNALPPWKRK